MKHLLVFSTLILASCRGQASDTKEWTLDELTKLKAQNLSLRMMAVKAQAEQELVKLQSELDTLRANACKGKIELSVCGLDPNTGKIIQIKPEKPAETKK